LPAWIGYAAWKSLPLENRPRFITTFHGYYSVNRYSAIMTKGERIIAISRAVASHIIEKYDVSAERIILIYRGVDETVFDPGLVSEDRIRSLKHRWQLHDVTAPILMLPGRLTQWKGQDVFIKSLSRIKSLPWIALCVGDKEENRSYGAFLKQLVVEACLEDRIRFVGHCEDMPAALMLADVVVSAASSEPEAFGRIAVEAQAMGKPVIATAHGGSLETVRDRETGWLVTPCDENELSEILAEAIENPAVRARFGRRGRAWVRDMFTVGKMCEKTLELYAGLVRESEGAHGDS
jgi:glycosyltransferase involved in cell wall biosynthesis